VAPFDADFRFYAVRGNNDGEPPAAVRLDTDTGGTEWHDLR